MTSANLQAWVWAIIRLWVVTIKFENKCFVTKISSKINYSNMCVQKTCTCRCSHALGDLKVVIVDEVWKEIFFFTKIILLVWKIFPFLCVQKICTCTCKSHALGNLKVVIVTGKCEKKYVTKILYLPVYKSTLFVGTQSYDFTYFWSTTWFRNLIILLKHCVKKKIVSVKWHNARQDGLKSPKFSAMLLG